LVALYAYVHSAILVYYLLYCRVFRCSHQEMTDDLKNGDIAKTARDVISLFRFCSLPFAGPAFLENNVIFTCSHTQKLVHFSVCRK